MAVSELPTLLKRNKFLICHITLYDSCGVGATNMRGAI